MLEKVIERDQIILIKLNKQFRCRILDFLMPKITYLGSVQVSILVSVLSLFFIHSALKLLISLIISSGICNLIKFSVGRVRPFLVIKDLNINKIGIDEYSFPSGHTTAAFSLAISLCFMFPHLSILFIIMAIAVGFSRLYLGVHYATDVAIGLLIGMITSTLININM